VVGWFRDKNDWTAVRADLKPSIKQKTLIGRALTHNRSAMPFGNRKIILEDLFSSVLSQYKKISPSGNLKFNYLGIYTA